MNQKELKELSEFLRELAEFLIEKDIAEIELERADVKVRIKRAGVHGAAAVHYVPAQVPAGTAPFAVPASAAPAGGSASTALPQAPQDDDLGLQTVKSPIVGTFYEAPSPGAPPFAKPGDRIEVGQVLCIIEAMKLMNEIESEYAGELVKRLVQNGQPVEYGQPLFSIRPQG